MTSRILAIYVALISLAVFCSVALWEFHIEHRFDSALTEAADDESNLEKWLEVLFAVVTAASVCAAEPAQAPASGLGLRQRPPSPPATRKPTKRLQKCCSYMPRSKKYAPRRMSSARRLYRRHVSHVLKMSSEYCTVGRIHDM